MDGHGGVNNLRLNSLLVDDGHNRLMDMMVDVLSGHCWRSSLSVVSLMCGGLILEASHLGGKSLLRG